MMMLKLVIVVEDVETELDINFYPNWMSRLEVTCRNVQSELSEQL